MNTDYPDATWKPSPNFNERPDDMEIDTIVLHATGGGLEPTLAWFANPQSGVSAHYVVGKDGAVFQSVREAERAWHAGVSHMADGREDVNDFAIGIELANMNDGADPYPPEQMDGIVALVRYLADKYKIPAENVVTHAEIAPDRKTDPLGFPVPDLLVQAYNLATPPPDSVVRNAAWNAGGIPYNPDAAFPTFARENGLGNPETPEFDFEHRGRQYRGQGFSQSIVYAAVGEWDKMEVIKW